MTVVGEWQSWLRRRYGEDDLGRFVEYEGDGIPLVRMRANDDLTFTVDVEEVGKTWWCVGCNTTYDDPALVPCAVCGYSGRSSVRLPDPPVDAQEALGRKIGGRR